MSDIELKIVNATGLDPGKIYLIEVDREKVSGTQIESLVRYLHKKGFRGIAIRTHGGDGLRVVEPTEEPAESVYGERGERG